MEPKKSATISEPIGHEKSVPGSHSDRDTRVSTNGYPDRSLRSSGESDVVRDASQAPDHSAEIQRVMQMVPPDETRDLYGYFTSPTGSGRLKPFLDALTQWWSGVGERPLNHGVIRSIGLLRDDPELEALDKRIRRDRQSKKCVPG
jgi:hypothetical protein